MGKIQDIPIACSSGQRDAAMTEGWLAAPKLENQVKWMNYCYILRCSDGSLYTGWTNNLKKRFKAHCDGKGAKYTRGRGPFKLVFVEEFDTKEMAMKREYEIKQLTRNKKEKIIEQWQLKRQGLFDSYVEDDV